MPRSCAIILVFLLFLACCGIAAADDTSFINVVVGSSDGNSHNRNGTQKGGAQKPDVNHMLKNASEQPQYRQAAYGPMLPPPPPPPAPPPPFLPPPPGFGTPVTKCKGSVCPPVKTPPCILPRRQCGQWEASVQVFFARFKGIMRWPETGTDVHLNDDLGLRDYNVFLEYSGRYQIRPNWGIFYSVMPIEIDEITVLPRTITFGEWTYPQGTRVHTKYQFLYQRVGLLYQPINTCNASVSVTGAWTFTDQRTRINGGICGGTGNTLDRTRNMVMSGLEIQRCISSMCNGGTLSCDNRVGIGYLDDTFILDVQSGFRFTVPMNCGRKGYLAGGYRLLDIREDRPGLRLDTMLEGTYVELGLIF